MIVLGILLILKIQLFINASNIEHNSITIFLISSGISLLILSLIGLRKYKARKGILSIFYSLVSIIMLVDVVYYTYFHSLPSIMMLGQAGQLADVKDSVVSILSLKNLLFVIDIPLVILYLFKWNRDEELEISGKTQKGIPLALLILLIGGFSLLHPNGQINSIKLQELYTFHFTDIKNSLKKEESLSLKDNSTFTEEDLEEFIERRKSIEGRYTGLGKDRNLIVIQVEALQSFVVDLEYLGQEITPNINKIIQEESTLYYDNYYQLLGRGNTADAEFVSNNSLHPSMESPSYSQYENNTYYGLPWVLKDHGYNSWVFHGYKKEFWNREAAYPNQGFDRFLSEEDYEFEEVIELGITDRDFFDQSMDYLKELDSIDDHPFYAFLVTLSSHNPFIMPEEYHVLEIEDKYKDTILGNYLQSIHYADQCIGDFIEGLKEEGLYDNSVIAMYGDHFAIQNTTEEIHDMMEDFLGHKYDYDDIMKIPLTIQIPGEDIGKTISTIGSQLDFFPTILNIMGVENEKGIVFGRDLNHYEGYTNVTPQTIMRKGSFIDEDVIFSISRTEIFDHSIAMDPQSRELMEIDKFRPIYEKAIEEINKSNFILKNDLIKQLLENDGVLDFGQVEVKNIKGKEKIIKSKSNDIESLTQNYNKGNKIISLEVEMNPEEKIILAGGEPIEELAKWSELYQDAHIVFTTKREEIDELDELYRRIKYPVTRATCDFIVEIDSFDKHYFVTAYGYENILLNITKQDYREDEILDFLRVHDLFGLVVDEKILDKNLKAKIIKEGIDIYREDQEGYWMLNKKS